MTHFESFGAVGDNVTDCTPALVAALAAGCKHLECGGVPATKHYRFLTKTPPLNGIFLHGCGVSSCALVKAWNSTYYGDALLDFTGSAANGGGVEGMTLGAANSYGGSLLRAISTLGSPASYLSFENLNFTFDVGGSYDRCILLDGSQAVTGAQGVRTPKLHNITAFQTAPGLCAIEAVNAVSLMGTNIWTNANVRIGGTGAPGGNSTSCSLSNLIAGGTLFIDNAAGISVHGQVPVLHIADTVFNGTYHGVVNSVTNLSPRFRVYGSC